MLFQIFSSEESDSVYQTGTNKQLFFIRFLQLSIIPPVCISSDSSIHLPFYLLQRYHYSRKVSNLNCWFLIPSIQIWYALSQLIWMKSLLWKNFRYYLLMIKIMLNFCFSLSSIGRPIQKRSGKRVNLSITLVKNKSNTKSEESNKLFLFFDGRIYRASFADHIFESFDLYRCVVVDRVEPLLFDFFERK